ncbi:TPA: haloacid dehalogenase-like hydrolase [Stenotrophomonas maltophilia]
MHSKPPVVVFDFDLTLTRWDTADQFFRWLLRRSPARMAVLLAALPALAPLLLTGFTQRWPIRFAVWVSTIGRKPDALPALVEEFIQTLPLGSESVLLPAGVERLQAHMERGDEVVIATGCLDALASALLRHAGLEQVPLVASTVRPFLGGLVQDQHCYGPNKIPMLAARGYAPPWAVAYTDHRADLPVLKLAAERFLIDPKPECVTRLEAALASKMKILNWR